MTFRIDLVRQGQIVASFTWETNDYPSAGLDDWSESAAGLVIDPGSGLPPLSVRIRRIL